MRFFIMRFYCQKDSSYMTKIKKVAHVLWAAYSILLIKVAVLLAFLTGWLLFILFLAFVLSVLE